jgi:thioredoxin-related protein
MRYLTVISLAAALGLLSLAAQLKNPQPAPTPAVAMKWYSFEEAVALNKTKPKKIMIDVYTDWCGWCKRMDKGAFVDPAVAEYMNANYYPVKLNAEQKEEIVFGRDTFRYVQSDGQRGIHTLAYSLLDGQMGYPSIVYLDEQYRRIMVSPGYKESPDLMKELKFAAEGHYNKTSWEEYREQQK